MQTKLLSAAKDLINKADEFHGKFPAAADKVDELFMPGLTEYNKAFETLRKVVSKAENAKR